MSKLIFVAAFCSMLVVCFALPAKADTTYTYTGPEFNNPLAENPCPSSCNITGSFTLVTPLPPNETGVTIPADTPFAFSIGPFTATNLSNGPFPISTNAAGAIDGWNIELTETLFDGLIVVDITSSNFGDSILELIQIEPGLFKEVGESSTSGAAGFWTVSTTGTGVPEPSTVTLLVAGMIGLLSLGLKKHA